MQRTSWEQEMGQGSSKVTAGMQKASLFKSKVDPDLEFLGQWIDAEVRLAPGVRVTIMVLLIALGFAISFSLVWFLTATAQIPDLLALAPAILLSVGTAIWALMWYQRAHEKEERAFGRLGAEWRVSWKLNVARRQGKLRSLLGEEVAFLLNEAAKEWIRCRESFDNPIWRTAGLGSPWGHARKHAIRSMDNAMARMMLSVCPGKRTQEELAPAKNLLMDMRNMADEAERLRERLEERKDSMMGEATGELRRALGEVRMLAATEDKLDDARRRI
jgi:hypothetical protein